MGAIAFIKGTDIPVWAHDLNETLRKMFDFENEDRKYRVIGVIPKRNTIKHFRNVNPSPNILEMMKASSCGVSATHRRIADELQAAFQMGVPIILVLKKRGHDCPFKKIKFSKECENCKLCLKPKEVRWNLTEYFDSCDCEKIYQDPRGFYRIDVCFSKNDGTNLWVEIRYTHETKGLKILQGNSVLELDIREGDVLTKEEGRIIIKEGRTAMLFGIEFLPEIFEGSYCLEKTCIERKRKLELENLKLKNKKVLDAIKKRAVLDVPLIFGSCEGYTIREISQMQVVHLGKGKKKRTKSGIEYCEWLFEQCQKGKKLFMQPDLLLTEKDLAELKSKK